MREAVHRHLYLPGAVRSGPLLPAVHGKGIPHKIEVEEYTNLSLPLMLMAGALGMPFVPVKDMVGTDLMNIKSFMGDNKYKMIESPFDGSPVLLAPALRPDVAIIHVQQADEDGNAQMWGIGGDCKWGANAAKKVIVSCERIVSRETVGKDPSRTIVPSFKVVGRHRGALRRPSRIYTRLL
ncbi:MAG: hypothetical protein MZU91_08650 [Desulfosudis oleivorans]|nr:hypothetical protein [Desulfosudis oleivorans]